MSFVRSMITELREKRLWPVAAVLVIGLIAVPVLLSKSSAPAAPAPPLPLVAGSPPALPAVSVTTTPSDARLTGPEHDPFHQQVKPSSGTSPSAGAGSRSSGQGKGSAGSGQSGTSGSSSAGSTSTGSSSTGTSSTGTSTGSPSTGTTSAPATKPAPGLTNTQAYGVSISITTSGGGVSTIDPLQRLSLVPSARQPQLIELGVLKDSGSVLFVVQPGTVVRGAGTCTPGPIDCEVVALRPNQIERISKQTSRGLVTVAQMAVTGVNVNNYPSAAAADRARRQGSSAGRRLLNRSTLSAVSLFSYDPGAGAVVDMRNLTVGGN